MRKNARAYISLIIFMCVLIWTFFSSGQAKATTITNNHYFESVQKRLIKDGFDSEKIKTLYSRPQVSFEADGVTVFFTYSEAKVDYDQFANDWSIRKAKEFMEIHQEKLSRAESAYGVESQVITAILLVETGLGATLGERSTLNTLSTMASLVDPDVRNMFWEMIPDSKRIPRKQFEEKANRKSRWAYRELKAFLTYAYREGFDPAEIPGSIAGAIGLAQFMPSNILAYGKDGNNDGAIDLHNHADSMASIANFLKRHGWRPGISQKKAEKIIYYYNHSSYYVKTILKIANLLKA
jgi:membrane-bound lytic murein transglycosylase B